jgi:hypothetical protein
MRALASHRGGKTPELFALPASSLGLAGDPPAEQNKLLVQRKRAGGWNISTPKSNVGLPMRSRGADDVEGSKNEVGVETMSLRDSQK